MRHGPFRSRWLYGTQPVEQQQWQQHVNPAFSGAHALDYRLPDVYGRRQNEYIGSPMAQREMAPLYRKVGYICV